jgi:hypothetical protein
MEGGIMITKSKKLSACLGLVLFCAGATASAGDYSDQRLADARDMMQRGQVGQAASSLEKALPYLVESQDLWSASRAYFQLAVARGSQHNNGAACAALSKSLDYYRKALIRDNLSLVHFGDMASDGLEGSDGMREVGAKFGCTGSWSAASNAGGRR